MMQEFYNMNMEFYKKIEQDFGAFGFGKYEWISLHLRYLIYYGFIISVWDLPTTDSK